MCTFCPPPNPRLAGLSRSGLGSRALLQWRCGLNKRKPIDGGEFYWDFIGPRLPAVCPVRRSEPCRAARSEQMLGSRGREPGMRRSWVRPLAPRRAVKSRRGSLARQPMAMNAPVNFYLGGRGCRGIENRGDASESLRNPRVWRVTRFAPSSEIKGLQPATKIAPSIRLKIAQGADGADFASFDVQCWERI